MRVQRVLMPGSEAESWTVLGDDQVPVEPVERFLGYLTSIEKSPNTVKAYAHDLKDWFTYLTGHDLDWQAVTVEDVAGFVAWLRLPPEGRDGKVAVLPTVENHCSAASVNRKLAALTSFCEFHARHGVKLAGLLTTLQPAGRRGSATSYKPFLHHVTKSGPQRRRTIKLKASRPRPKVLTAAEAQAILDACDHLRDRLLFALLLDCGVRIGEALGLRHEDMGIAERAVTVTPRPQRQPGPRQGGHLPDHPGQRRADAAVCRLPHPRVRLAGLGLRLRQPVVAALRPPVDLCRRLRPGAKAAGTDRDRLRAPPVSPHLRDLAVKARSCIRCNIPGQA